MMSGQTYKASDPVLVSERAVAHSLCHKFNSSGGLSVELQNKLFNIFSSTGSNCYIEAPFYCDYGYNIELGKSVYFNFNVTILDCAPVKIGDFVKLGPGVQIYTAGHSVEPERRRSGDEFALPVVIEENAWVGGSAIILPGIRIGRNSIVGAGSVVTKDVPDGVTVAGSPARTIKTHLMT